ncbi:MAG: hypothetical protein WC525_02165 [Candidatus Thermoplasmatota archaeon]
MSLRRLTSLQGTEQAVLGQPMGLLIIILVAGVIFTGFCLFTPMLIRDAQLNQVESQIDKILIEAATMFDYAEYGSRVTVHVEFPESMRFIVFGHLPSTIMSEPANQTFDETTSNNYYLVMNDGTVRVSHSNVRFSNQDLTRWMLFRSGAYDITLQLCQKEGVTYVAMSEGHP